MLAGPCASTGLLFLKMDQMIRLGFSSRFFVTIFGFCGTALAHGGSKRYTENEARC
jgi:hypothetical protein